MNQSPFAQFSQFQFPFADMMKGAMDFNQLFSSRRRDMEALSSANQIMVEGAQAVSRAQAEALRSNAEAMLKTSKDMFSGGTPDLSKQAEAARSVFENTLASLREITEMSAKCGYEAFQVLNDRASETFGEMNDACNPAKPKKK